MSLLAGYMSMILNKRALFIFLAVLLTSCSSLDAEFDELTVKVRVEQGESLHYTGKGAGAGMMMAGSMGPMGIAIGAAIDSGIAKDIKENAFSGTGLQLADIVQEGFASVAEEGDIDILVRRYGFQAARAEGMVDPTGPVLDLEVSWQRGGGPDILKIVRVPSDVVDLGGCTLPAYELEVLKKEAAKTVAALRSASHCAALWVLNELRKG